MGGTLLKLKMVVMKNIDSQFVSAVCLFLAGILLLIIVVTGNARGQTGIHVYVKSGSATASWNHTPLEIACQKIQNGSVVSEERIFFNRGEDRSYVCGDKTYSLTWNGNIATIPNFHEDGSAYVSEWKYLYRFVRIADSGIMIPATGAGSYTFTIPTAGQYLIWGYVQVDNMDGGCDSFFTKMDAGPETIWDTPNSNTPGSWIWDRINDRFASDVGSTPVPIVYDLSAGEHVLTLRDREPCTKLNGLVVLPLGVLPQSETVVHQGETVDNSAEIPLTFGQKDYRFEVKAVRKVGTKETESLWAQSTDPIYAKVDDTHMGWIVRVIGEFFAPESVKGIRVFQ
jgi:hypothetical protein